MLRYLMVKVFNTASLNLCYWWQAQAWGPAPGLNSDRFFLLAPQSVAAKFSANDRIGLDIGRWASRVAELCKSGLMLGPPLDFKLPVWVRVWLWIFLYLLSLHIDDTVFNTRAFRHPQQGEVNEPPWNSLTNGEGRCRMQLTKSLSETRPKILEIRALI